MLTHSVAYRSTGGVGVFYVLVDLCALRVAERVGVFRVVGLRVRDFGRTAVTCW